MGVQYTTAGLQWLRLVERKWDRKPLLQTESYHMMINNQRSATYTRSSVFATMLLTLNQQDSIIHVRSYPMRHSTCGVSVLRACNIPQSSHDYLGAVLFDVIKCTSYLRFKWVVQQFER